MRESDVSCIKERVSAWILGHQDELPGMRLTLVDLSPSSIILKADEKLLEMVIPSSFNVTTGFCVASAFIGEVFLVTSIGDKLDTTFQPVLMRLNEKLERLELTSDALNEALNHLLTALQKYQLKSDRQIVAREGEGRFMENDQSGGESEEEADIFDSSDDSLVHDMGGDEAINNSIGAAIQHRSRGFLYKFGEEAKQICEVAKLSADQRHLDVGVFDSESVLRWGTFRSSPEMLTIDLLIQMGGIMRHDSIASALGFPLDTPVKVSMQFCKELWSKVEYKVPLKLESCSFQEFDLEGETQKLRMGDQDHYYGMKVLLPELVQSYFDYLAHGTPPQGKKLEGSDLLSKLQQFSKMDNPFIGCFCFLCSQLRALPDWCVVCWNPLPYSVYRLRTCDREFCLFRFEELGMGMPLLHEVQTCPELIDFELSLALVASCSSRNVFEPFPPFLLEKEEIRGRCGWFSKVERADYNISSVQTAARSSWQPLRLNSASNAWNKKLGLLNEILLSYPPVDVMKQCHNEGAFKGILSRCWPKKREQTLGGKRPEEPEGSTVCESSAWLPYNVLRFILSTSRSTLHLLKGEEKLVIGDACYQFAVLHDNPEREAHFEQRKIEQGGSFFAFHGSSADNWFSILRNGLRSLSNTAYMSAGASLGTGIYFATMAGTSSVYSACKGPGWGHGLLKEGFCVLSICEIINGSIRPPVNNPCHLLHNIIVVPPEYEKDVAVRYIFVFQGSVDCGNLEIKGAMLSGTLDLKEHLQAVKSSYTSSQERQRRARREACWQNFLVISDEKQMKEEVAVHPESYAQKHEGKADHSQDCNVTSSSIQAVSRELKNFTNQIKAFKKSPVREYDFPILAGVEVDLPTDDVSRWHVSLSKDLFKQWPLHKDLIECAKHWNLAEVAVKLECIFPMTYPFAPPFIRVISPRFAFHTGHVTVGGSICMELLTRSGWSPACSFENVLVQIVNAMIEGGGRLDKAAWSSRREYSELEAREAFDRVARDHGWV